MLARCCATALTAAAILSGGCTSLDPAADREELAGALRQRAGSDLTALPDGISPEIVDDVRALLRAPIDAAAAVRLALLNNHRVRAVQEQLGVGRADLVQAGLLRNPTFDFDARFVAGGGTDLEFGISQPILELFFRPLRMRVAAHEFAALRLRLADELLQLIYSVRRAHVRALLASELVDLHRQGLAVAEAGHEMAIELHAAGNLTDRQLAAERAAETRARLDLAAAEQAAREAREPLQALLGLWGEETTWTIGGELPRDPLQGIDLTHVETRAIAASIDLQALREGLNALAQQVGLDSWRGWFPELAVGVNGIRIPGGTWGFGPRAAGTLPLFDTGATRRERTSARLRAGMHDQVQIAVEVRAAARLLRERAARLAAQVSFLRDFHLPQRAEVLRATLQTYNAMQIGAFDVLVQRQVQIADTRDYLQTLRAAHLARLDLELLLAGSRPDSADLALSARGLDERLAPDRTRLTP